MLSDSRLRIIHDFPETSEVFPGVNVRGGICYFLWDRDYKGDCLVVNHQNGEVISTATRPLLEKGATSFIRYNQAVEILKKVQSFKEETVDYMVSARKPFGLATNFSDYTNQKTPDKDIYLYRFGDNAYVSKHSISKNLEWVYKYKVLVPYASPGSDDYPHLVLSKPIVSGPGEACTETYLVIGPFDHQEEAENMALYMRTQFFRFMLLLLKSTQHITQKVYSFVPYQDLHEKWTDEKLYQKYNITKEEVKFINTLVKPLAD